MKTEELINILSQAPAVRRPLHPGIVAALLAGLCGIGTCIGLGLRPELGEWYFPGSFWVKTIVLCSAFILFTSSLLDESVPVPRHRKSGIKYIFLTVIILLLFHEWLTVPEQQILALFFLPNFMSCLFFVTLYGVFCTAILLLLMRYYAPADPVKAAGLIGAAAGSAGAAGYSVHCFIDSPTFVVVAYGIPVAMIFLLGRIVLPKYLRW